MIWQCELCGSIQNSDPFTIHTMEFCECRKTAVDNAGAYMRMLGRENIRTIKSDKDIILDSLFRNEISLEIAADRLDVELDELHLMIDDHDYTPTVEEEAECCRIITKNLEENNE